MRTESQAARITPHLNYEGGKILTESTLEPIYYGTYWKTAPGQADRDYFEAFTKSFAKGKHMSIWAEYGANKPKVAPSDLVAPRRQLTMVNDAAIRKIITQELKARRVTPNDGKTVYTVFLPPHTVLEAPGNASSLQGVAGYHYSFTDSTGKPVYYAAIVYSTEENGIQFNENPRDSVTIAASHEWTEAVTDPDVNAGKLGWYDPNYGEISDIAMSVGLPLSQTYARQDGFAVQREWSNKDRALEVERKGR